MSIITIPNTVTEIANTAFSERIGLSVIRYTGSKAEWDKYGLTEDDINHATVYYNYDPNHDHSYEETIIHPASCTETGLKKMICSLCGEFYEEEIPLVHTGELKLLGQHNFENVMAASAMAYYAGVPGESIRKSICEFTAVAHRIEYVTEKKGVVYYNDSKGTNPDAAIKGIQAMNRPTLLIGGGYDKQSGYDEWIEAFDGKVRYLVLIGQTKEKIKEAAEKHGFHDIILCEDLKEAVKVCEEKAQPGDAVLLSPACASWGQFDNYEQRGDMFKEYVRNL